MRSCLIRKWAVSRRSELATARVAACFRPRCTRGRRRPSRPISVQPSARAEIDRGRQQRLRVLERAEPEEREVGQFGAAPGDVGVALGAEGEQALRGAARQEAGDAGAAGQQRGAVGGGQRLEPAQVGRCRSRRADGPPRDRTSGSRACGGASRTAARPARRACSTGCRTASGAGCGCRAPAARRSPARAPAAARGAGWRARVRRPAAAAARAAPSASGAGRTAGRAGTASTGRTGRSRRCRASPRARS